MDLHIIGSLPVSRGRPIGRKYLRNVVLYDPTGSLYDGGGWGVPGFLGT